MARINKIPQSVYTHEGGKAKKVNAEDRLRRSILSCLLWENEFYEDGETIAKRIESLVKEVKPSTVAKLAVEARYEMKLRHAPLLLAAAMVKLPTHRSLVADTLKQIVNRPDELSEFLAIYWKNGKCPVANQVKIGLGNAFKKFNEYQLAKWNRSTEIKLRDVMRICHPKPENSAQSDMWKRLLNDELVTPDTHEVAMSMKGVDKSSEWTRLIEENKLGGMAVLKNLRRMENDGVDRDMIKKAIRQMNTDYVLPYRFISAAKYAPALESDLEDSMIECLSTAKKMKGRTVLLIDVSASMYSQVSEKSEITSLDAACGLGILLSEICEDVDIYTFSSKLVRVPSRRGFALRDAIVNSQKHSSTYLGASVTALTLPKDKSIRFKGTYHGHLTFNGQGLNPDRLIVISDEQSNDKVPDPKSKGYMINVASNKYGVGYGAWTHCDGWSESVVRWIQELEIEQF